MIEVKLNPLNQNGNYTFEEHLNGAMCLFVEDLMTEMQDKNLNYVFRGA